MKNLLVMTAFCIAVICFSISSLAHQEIHRLSTAESSYHGKSQEVIEMFEDFPKGFVLFVAKPESDGLRLAPHPDNNHWNTLSNDIKSFLQRLLDEVVSNKLCIAANARIAAIQFSERPSELSANWHVDGRHDKEEFRNAPRTFISFSDSNDNLSTRFSSLTPKSGVEKVHFEDYAEIEAHLVHGIQEGDFASGDMHYIYHRGPSQQELGSSTRLLIIFEGRIFPEM